MLVTGQMTSNNSEHHLAINEEIMKRLKPTSKSYTGKRAVIVFFESIEELEVVYAPTVYLVGFLRPFSAAHRASTRRMLSRV